MQLTLGGLEDHLAAVAQLLERYGVSLDLDPSGELIIERAPRGSVSFHLRGYLPDGRRPPGTVVEVREVWRPGREGRVERWAYAYELLDDERRFRRAFHLHDRDAFIRRYQVVVHEHCEHPIGVAPCEHLEGRPVRDAFDGVERLLDIWTDPSLPECAALRCLER